MRAVSLLTTELVTAVTTYKVALAGAPGVGKTRLLDSFGADKSEVLRTTAPGLEVRVYALWLDGEPVQIAFWDIAGQDRIFRLCDQFFDGVHAIGLVYDVAMPFTFFDAMFWRESVQGIAPLVPILVIGNKIDLRAVVPHEEVQGWAAIHQMGFVLTSTRTGEGISVALEMLTRLAVQEYRRRAVLSRVDCASPRGSRDLATG
jgi:small GTP-binding protein